MARLFCVVCTFLLLTSSAFAQSQAANGAIEGTVTDSSGAVLPGVTVSVIGDDNGVLRAVVTNEAGVFRAPLLPLGAYRVTAELQGFKKFEQTNILLSVGQTVVVNPVMAVGGVTETVTVNAADKPALDPGRIDVGHTMTDVEVKNLPLVARNPYNFALVQPGVTGIENVEFGVPRLAANGAAMRINYQVDGNTNTEKDRAGLRLLPISEVMVQEVKVVTTGFAPEFGQTMGMVYNAVTPSGTNRFRGDGTYLFRRRDFSAYPFFFGCGGSTPAKNCPAIPDNATKPDTKVDTGTATLGGPILRNKLFFYAGWEQTRRDLSSTKLITVSPDVVAQLGLPPQPAAAPNTQTGKFAIGKADYQVNGSNRLTGRWIRFHNDAPYNATTNSGATLERQTNFLDAMDSTAGQLVSTVGSSTLNEVRVQYAHRHQLSTANSDSGTGPAVNISSPAVGFGGPVAVTGQDAAGFDFKQNITQVIENLTYLRGKHSYKFGVDYQHVYDERTAAPQWVYNFATIPAYQAAKSGANPFSYSTMTQITGNLSFNMKTNLFSGFVQDDWQLGPTLKLLYGVRYDVYMFPSGLADAPLESSRSFNVDHNNFGPRVGIAWSPDQKTVVRASTGIMYDQPLLGAYEQALLQSGSPTAPTYTFNSGQAGAPAFPTSVATAGVLAVQSPWTVDPGFVIGHTWNNNVQVERALPNQMTVSAAFMYAQGRDLPVVSDVNLQNPVFTLPDGRPVFVAAVTNTTRVDPRFNHIMEVQSIGESTFKSMTLQVSKRFNRGLTFNVQYAFGKGEDNTPLLTQLTVQSEPGRSDPTNLDRDRGPNPLDMRHNLTGDVVFTSSSGASNPVVRGLLNGNEIGVLIQVNSGLPVNILSAAGDLNRDGVLSDRPVGVSRNSLYLPVRKNVDLRYTRWIPISGSFRGEVIAELKNVFNTEQMSGINTSVPTDAVGNPLTPIPTDPYEFLAPTGYEQRKFQLGFRVRF
jgi:hypothetical protein